MLTYYKSSPPSRNIQIQYNIISSKIFNLIKFCFFFFKIIIDIRRRRKKSSLSNILPIPPYLSCPVRLSVHPTKKNGESYYKIGGWTVRITLEDFRAHNNRKIYTTHHHLASIKDISILDEKAYTILKN